MDKTEIKKILLVEDDAITSMAESRTLAKHGFSVVPVYTGEDAVEYCLSRDDIDLVLMDIDLGHGMDGTEAARIIIKERRLPVLFLSSHTEPGIVAKTEEITSYGYVVKNSGETVLTASIRMAFRLHEATMRLQQKTMETEANNEELQAAMEELEATNEELILSQKEIIKRESMLMESEERFRAILNATRDIILVADASTKKFIYGNNASYGMLGYTDEEIRSLAVSDIHPKEKIGDVTEAFEKLLLGEIEVAPDIPVIRKDSGLFFADIIAYPILLDGKPALVGVFHDITERKAAQEEVARQRDFIETALDSLPGLFYLFDEQGHFLRWNKNFEKVSGYSADEISRMNPLDFFDETGKPLIDQGIRMGFSTGQAMAEAEFISKNGNTTPCLFSGKLFDFQDKKCLIGMGVDITERIKAQQAAESERSFISAALDSLPGLFYLFDEGGHFLRWNINFEKVSGYSAGEISRMNPLDFFNENDKIIVGERIRQTFLTGQSSAEAEFRSKSGEKTPCLFTGRLFVFHGKKCLIGMGVDITERKAAQEAIMTERNFMNAVFDSVPGLLYLYDWEGHLRQWNKNHETLTGYSHDELDGMFILDWFDPNDKETVDIRMGVERAFQEGYASATGLLMTKSKGKIPCSFTAVRLEIQGKKYITGIGIDITDRIKAEHAFIKTVEEKESLLKELQHRVKNSLNMIISLISLEAGKTNEPAVRETMETLTGRVNTISNLYTMLYSGGEARDVMLDHYLEDIAHSLITAYSGGSAGLKLELDNVTVDTKKASAFGLILNELLTNAIKHSSPEKKEGTIEVRLKRENGGILLEVADNGRGLSGDFEISASNGLGLALVRMLAQQLGGEARYNRDSKTRFSVIVKAMQQ